MILINSVHLPTYVCYRLIPPKKLSLIGRRMRPIHILRDPTEPRVTVAPMYCLMQF
jgi:hypothetical protein